MVVFFLCDKHYLKIVQIRSIFWSVFSPNTGKYGPEKNPYLDTFHAVKVTLFILKEFIPNFDHGQGI